jgi:dienelactone hydrolase
VSAGIAERLTLPIGETNHGWMAPDSQDHNAEAAEKGWARKLALFKKALA